MVSSARYRIEDGQPCIDVGVGSPEQLFDNRDPAPFRERDLDPDLVEYLYAAAEDVHAHGRLHVVIWFAEPRTAPDIEDAYRGHLAYELERLARSRRRQRRTGQLALLIGITLLVGLLSLAQLLDDHGSGPLSALREGIVILSWVVLWRPVEVLLYDWIPLRRKQRLMTALHQARVDARVGKPPAPARM